MFTVTVQLASSEEKSVKRTELADQTHACVHYLNKMESYFTLKSKETSSLLIEKFVFFSFIIMIFSFYIDIIFRTVKAHYNPL